ncbi:hypothetical protein GF385_01805 [Candidatus Dependentiae bacterium]|nr:hypothetical protein [Candidatus Dependentiae bacterium]
MSKKFAKIFLRLSLLGCLVSNVAIATEFRSPWLSERGPIRYIFEKDNPDRYSLDTYALAHRRESHKAFLKHGTDTKPLTALFFNKSDFPVQEIFPNNQLDPNSKYYNPYMALAILHPRATYYEWGMTLGARFEYPVYEDKGRIGFRINIPVRAIEVEREDITSPVDNPEDEYILTAYTKVGNYRPAEGGLNTRYAESVDIISKAYNMNFIAQLFQNQSRDSALQFSDGSAKVFGVEIAKDFDTNDKSFKTDIKPVAGVIEATGTGFPNEPNFSDTAWGYVTGDTNGTDIDKDIAKAGSPGGYGERAGASPILAVQNRHNWAFDAGDDVKIAGASLQSRQINRTATTFPTAGQATEIMKAPNTAFFTTAAANSGKDNAYSNFMDSNNYPTNMPTYLKNSWLVLGYDNGQLVPGATTIRDGIENAVRQYNQDPYEWLYDKGFEFETQRRTGIGDIDLDFFYEHRFNEEWITEIMIGLRFPTGSDDDYSGNPYKAHLGNGEHWEIKLGGLAAWQPIDWMNLKLDTYVSFVLEATEQRCAVFEGSSIKNIGPKVDADVDWTYFVLRLDSTMFHPKTKDISGTVGYELYWKTEDNLHFKKSQETPFYGSHFSDPSNLLKSNLDNGLAEANTEAIAHRLRGEIRIKINEWFEIDGGGAFTFAGQNIPREFDAHGGFVIRF